MPKRFEVPPLEGKKFKGVTVLEYAGRKNARNMWRCRCNRCGKEVVLRQDVILADVIKSCGCYRCRDPKKDPRGNDDEHLVGPVVLYASNGEQSRGKLFEDRLVLHGETVSPKDLEEKGIRVWSSYERTRQHLERLGFHPGSPVRKHNIQLPDSTYMPLAQYARSLGITSSQMINNILTDWVRRKAPRD